MIKGMILLDHYNKRAATDVLSHHGVKGMKWGVRRFQNEDGSLTSSGQKRYGGNKSETGKSKRVVAGIAVGATAVAGVVLTAYLVKKFGHQKPSEIAGKANTGKAAVEKLLKDSPIASTPVRQLQMPRSGSSVGKVKGAVEKVVKATTSIPKSQPQIPKINVEKTANAIPQSYDFETLIKQNSDLLKKMYAEIT